MGGKKKSGGGKNKAEKELSKAQRIEAKKAKQAAKGAKKDRKQQAPEEEDIDTILAEILRKDAQRKEIVVEACTQPSPRANFSMTMLPSGEMMLFGGEYFDGEVNVCYNDLLRWNVDGGPEDWKLISSPNTPPPRCSHQAAVFRDHLYVIGGEFATADQFHHYRDFWRLDLKTNSWEALDDRGGPSARSGHRMVVWRNYLVIFGGFYEAARETRWFNDVYLFNCTELKWRKVTYPVNRAVPAPRSGCQLAVHPSKDIVFLYGGYAKVKKVGEKAEGKVFSDLWALDMAPVLKNQEPVWEKQSRKGHAPTPRGGASVVVHKQRFVLFGGVRDEEQRGNVLQSTFYNDSFVYDMDRRRWFEFKLRGKKTAEGRRRRKKDKEQDASEQQDSEDSGSEGEEGQEDDFEKMLERQFGYIDQDGEFVFIDQEEEEEEKEDSGAGVVAGAEEEEKEEEKEEVKEEPKEASVVTKPVEKEPIKDEEPLPEEAKPDDAPMPCPRINPALIIRGSTLYVYGGMVEDGDREITLDDCWSLDLKRLEEWKEVLPGTMEEQVWKGELSETEGSYDSEEEDDDEDDDDEDTEEGEAADKPTTSTGRAVERAVSIFDTGAAASDSASDAHDAEKLKKKKKKKSSKSASSRRSILSEISKLQDQLGLDDRDRTPQMGENLRDFFARTDAYWARMIMQRPDTVERMLSAKEIKREGFALAEQRYNELLPILERLNVLEAEQKELEEQYQKKSGKDRARR